MPHKILDRRQQALLVGKRRPVVARQPGVAGAPGPWRRQAIPGIELGGERRQVEFAAITVVEYQPRALLLERNDFDETHVRCQPVRVVKPLRGQGIEAGGVAAAFAQPQRRQLAALLAVYQVYGRRIDAQFEFGHAAALMRLLARSF